MKLAELINGIGVIRSEADPETEITDIAYDTRLEIKPGSAFFAVRGEKTDGHLYINEALEHGASVVVCDTVPGSIPFIQVHNTQTALALASSNYFGNAAEHLKIIGVTGTKGKTTTTTLIKNIIEYITKKPVGLIGTVADMIGTKELPQSRTTPTTPEPYHLHRLLGEMYKAGCEYVCMEVSSHGLAEERVAGIMFEVGVFTNLGTNEHLDYHKTVEAYADAKASLFARSRNSVVNADDSYAGVMIVAALNKPFTYSINNLECDLVAKRVRLNRSSVEFSALTSTLLKSCTVKIPGEFTVYNALAAIGTCLQLGFDISEISEALAMSPGVRGRVEVVQTNTDYSVIIDYAHTAESLKQIISTLKASTDGKLITLFGCGGDRDKSKRPIMGSIASRMSDVVIITSDNPRTEDPEAIIDDIARGIDGTAEIKLISDRREAIEYALSIAKKGDTVLLAGKGQETYQERGHERFSFDERSIVQEILEARRELVC